MSQLPSTTIPTCVLNVVGPVNELLQVPSDRLQNGIPVVKTFTTRLAMWPLAGVAPGTLIAVGPSAARLANAGAVLPMALQRHRPVGIALAALALSVHRIT